MKIKKMFAALLSLVLVFTMLPGTVMATDGESAVDSDSVVADTTAASEEDGSAAYLDVELTGSDGVYNVTVSFDTDARIPEGSTVSVKELSESDEAYQEAKEQVEPENGEQFAALDISILDADGNEIEPASAVQVEIEVSGLPEDMDEDTEIIVSHIDESTGSPVAEAVADTADATEGTLEVNESSAVVSFTVNSFSVFTIQYASDDETVTVSVEGAGETDELVITLGELDASNESLTIVGYDFVRAQIGSGNDYTTITGLYKIEDSNGGYYATIEGNETTGMRISDTKDVTLVYETHRATYDVTYVIQVGGQTVTDNTDSIVAVTGASTVKSGDSLNLQQWFRMGMSL